MKIVRLRNRSQESRQAEIDLVNAIGGKVLQDPVGRLWAVPPINGWPPGVLSSTAFITDIVTLPETWRPIE